jgi:hypothetical protein
VKDGEKTASRNGSIPSSTLKVGEIASHIDLLPAMRGEGAGRRMRGPARHGLFLYLSETKKDFNAAFMAGVLS